MAFLRMEQVFLPHLMKTLLLLTASSLAANAAIIQLDLDGRGGTGLLTTNENPSAASGNGSGGEFGSGITIDTDTNIITISVGWGSGNGFTDLTGDVTAMHIHIGTAPGTAGFTQNAGVGVGLNSRPGFTASGTNGGFDGSAPLTAAQTEDILEGRAYINVHTAANGGGELRGQLVQVVPEPSSALLAMLGLTALMRRRR